MSVSMLVSTPLCLNAPDWLYYMYKSDPTEDDTDIMETLLPDDCTDRQMNTQTCLSIPTLVFNFNEVSRNLRLMQGTR